MRDDCSDGPTGRDERSVPSLWALTFFIFSMLRNREIVSTTPLAMTEEYQYTPKYIDYTGTLTSSGGYNWVFARPTVISQGYGYNERVGDSIRVKRIVFRGFGAANNGSAGPQIRRIMIFVDHQSNGGSLTAAQYFAYFSDPSYAYPIPDWHHRFTVLADYIEPDDLQWFSHYIDTDFVVHYNGSATAAQTNQVYVGVIYDDNSASDSAALWLRLFFEDC